MEKKLRGIPPLLETVSLARDISSQSWADTCTVTSHEGIETLYSEITDMSHRLFVLFCIRFIAILHSSGRADNLPNFPDLSTTSICETIIRTKTPLQWPECMSEEIFEQLYDFVYKILEMYRSVPYHNREHAFHVTVSAHKLLDLLLCDFDWTLTINLEPIKKPNRPSYGIKNDAIVQMAFLFSALVHDVDHTGISNRQLAVESDDLALMYNDQSVAEQRSLSVAFSLFRAASYEKLRALLFQQTEYIKFRKTVIDLVLCTDIASPERVQIVKSKWKEAFGDVRHNKHTTNLSRSIQATMFDSFDRGNEYKFEKSTFNSDMVASIAMVSISNDDKSSANEIELHKRKNSKDHTLNQFINYPVRKRLLKTFFKKKSRSFVQEKNIFRKLLRNSDTQDTSEKSSSKERLKTVDNKNSKAATSVMSNINDILSEYEEENLSVSSESSTTYDVLDSSSRKMMIKPQNTASSRRLFKRRNKSLELHDQSTVDDESHQNDFEKSQSEVKITPDPNETQSKRHSLDVPFVGESNRKSSFVLNPSSSTHGKRFSEPTMGYMDRKKFHFKLGIRRALDFTGSSVETYKSVDMQKSDPDQPDELKMMVTLEQLIKTADVAANMQRWETMLLWSSRLFKEQKNCFINGHGPDPEHDWYENQIAFFESYTMPLACRLVDTSVFELETVEQFVNGVRQNNIRWLVEGMDAMSSMVKEWNSSHTNFT